MRTIGRGLVTATPILYHYPMSPYSEKVRLAMGLNNQAWVQLSSRLSRRGARWMIWSVVIVEFPCFKSEPNFIVTQIGF